MSALMPNPFDYNSTVNSPRTVDQDVAHSPAAASDPAAIDSCQEPVAADLNEDDLYWSLRRADDPFERDLPEIPNPRALFNAIKGDSVWADPKPLFLRQAIG